MAKMYENPAKILIIFLDPMIKAPDVGLIKKAQDPFLQLTTALAWDNLNQADAFLNRFLHNPAQLVLDHFPAVIDIVKVEF
jgi:hypothetical protein